MSEDSESVAFLLARTPAVLEALLRGLPSSWLNTPEEPGAWSPRDVVCHLADLERDAWLPRIRAIVDRGSGAVLPAIDRERFRTTYADISLEAVLGELRTARAANLDALDALKLDEAALGAVGRHPDLGEVRLSHLLCAWVVHDLTHLNQVSRGLASQYRTEVGPWRTYLSILQSRRPEGGEPAGAS